MNSMLHQCLSHLSMNSSSALSGAIVVVKKSYPSRLFRSCVVHFAAWKLSDELIQAAPGDVLKDEITATHYFTPLR